MTTSLFTILYNIVAFILRLLSTSGSHRNSFIMLVTLSGLSLLYGFDATIGAPALLMASNCHLSFSWCSSQTTQQYSSNGRTKAVKARILVSLWQPCKFLLRNPRVRFALPMILEIGVSQDNFIMTPRLGCSDVSLRAFHQ